VSIDIEKELAMLDVTLTGDALSITSSILPSPDITDELHVTLADNGRLKLDPSIWTQLLTDERLRHLTLIDLQLYQSDACLLAEYLSKNTHIKVLTLQSVRQSLYAFDQILNDGLQSNRTIERLTLSNLNDVDAATIASLIQHNQSIRYLSLTHDHISSNGAALIADALRTNVILKSLDLSHNDITQAGALAFKDLLEQTSSHLAELNLSDNQIDCQTYEQLQCCSSSTRIIVSSDTQPILDKDELSMDSKDKSPVRTPRYLLSTVLVTFLFLLWGVPNQLNDVLIRQFSKAFVLSRFEAGLVQSAFYMGYFFWSLPAAYVLRRWSYKVGLIIGLVLFGTGSFLFWPAALVGDYTFFLLALFVIATGLAFLETAANPFIAHASGPAHSSEKRLNIAQAFNPLGAILGALGGTLFIFSGIELNPKQIEELRQNHTYDEYLKHETLRVVKPYAILGGIAYLWAIFIALAPFPKQTTAIDSSHSNRVTHGNTLCRPLFMCAILAQFVYVGAQVGTWSYFIQYAQDYVGVAEKLGGYLLTGTLGMFAIGRLMAAILMHCGFSPSILLATFSLVNVLLIVITVLMPNSIGLATLFLTSFFMSLMFPTIFALGIKGFDVHTTKLASCLLIMAIIGGAVFTPIMGFIEDQTRRLALAYTLPGGAYLIIALYALLAYVMTTE
jgi:MFS transporter, FHS family, L-fucose permease